MLQRPNKVLTSAVTGEGREQFLHLIDEKLASGSLEKNITISASSGDILAWLHSNARILTQTPIEDKIKLSVQISESKWQQLENRLK